jgi:beta-galactosidase
MLPEGTEGTVLSGNEDFSWDVWGEVLSPSKAAKVIATYSDQFYAGKPAATIRHLGYGSVTYIGVATTSGNLERDIVRSVYKEAGVAIEDFPRGIFMEWRDGFFVAVNYTDNGYQIPVTAGAMVITGNNPLEPAGVLVWK